MKKIQFLFPQRFFFFFFSVVPEASEGMKVDNCLVSMASFLGVKEGRRSKC